MAKRGRPPQYDWDRWLDGRSRVTLRQGKHFVCSITSMQIQVRAEARRRGKKVSVQKKSETSFDVINLGRQHKKKK